MTNTAFIKLDPIDTLPEQTSLVDGHLLFTPAGSTQMYRMSLDTFTLLSQSVKILKLTDPAPTVDGLYRPESVGTYSNTGGLVAKNGYDTIFLRKGGVWSKSEFPYQQASKSIPQFADLSFPVTNTATEKVQCVDNFVPYQLLDGKTSTSANTPSTSPTIWKPLENRNLRIYEDLPNGTILNPKEQVISNNVQYIVLQQAVVGTDLPTGVKFQFVGKKTATTFEPTNSTEQQGAKQIADAYSDVKIFAGSNVAELLKMSTNTSANVSAGFMQSNGVFAGHSNFFTTGFIKVEDSSFTYTTQLYSQYASICVYDENKVFLAGKSINNLVNTNGNLTERLLSTDFNLSTARFVRISSFNSTAIIVKYAVNLLVDNTIQVLDNSSKKAISSEAVKPIINDLDAVELLVASQSDSIELLKKEIEDVTLKQQPLYIEMATSFMKGFSGSAMDDLKIFNSISRDNDYQFTTTVSELTNFPTNNATHQIVVKNSAGKHFPIRCSINTTTGVVTTYDILPASFTQWSLIWANDIHLSRWGYLAMGEWFVDNCLLKTILRKKKIFGVYSRACDAEQRDWKIGGVVKLATQTIGSPLSGTAWAEDGITYYGGWGIGGRISATRLESKYTQDWLSSQKTKDVGFKFTINTGRVKGFIRLVYGISIGSKNPIKLNFKDQNGNVFYTETTLKKGLNELIVNIAKEVSAVTIEAIWTETGVTTKFIINDIELFETYQENTQIFKSGDVIAYYMDSWGGFPTLQSGEVSATRPDGSSVGGLAYFANRVKSYLIEKGITTEFYLIGRGGMTSAWGNYWVDKALDICPKKPDYLVTNFWINDSNSIANNASWQFGTGGTPYNDVAPLVSSYTNPQMWLDNMKSISQKALKRFIQPIIIGYPQKVGVNDNWEQRDVILLNQDKFLA